MYERANHATLAADLLARAKMLGATEADLVIADGDTFSVQVRLSAVERLTKAREKRLGLRVFFGKRSATTATSDFTRDSLAQLVSETCTLAKAVAEDQASGLPEAGQMATDYPDLDLYDSTTLESEAQIELARRAEAGACEADPRITNSEGAEFDSTSGHVTLANSHGFMGNYRSSSFSVAVSPIASDPGTGGMQRDSWYAVSRWFSRLEDPELVGREAARRTLRRLGARKVKTSRAPVIFDPETAATLLGHLCAAANGYALYKGASWLTGQLGQRIAAESVTIYDDGRLRDGLGSRPFDGEGLATRKTVVVDRGILNSYLLDTYSGGKLGLSSTGNASRGVGESPSVGPTNFYLSPGSSTPADIIGSVKQGLYVTELIGFGVNLATGDYSRGAAGIWIENGELTYPVQEITIAGNLKTMLRSMEMIGNDLRFRARVVSPTVRIGEMTIAGS